MRTAIWITVAAGLLTSLPSFGANLRNDGFETGDVAPWVAAGEGWRISVFSKDIKRGRYSAVNDVIVGGGDEFRVLHQEFKVAGGKTYEAGVWLRAACIEGSESFLEVQFLDDGGTVLRQFQSPHVKQDQDFTYISIGKMAAPEKATRASVRGVVRVITPPVSDIDYHIFDEFEFRRARN